MIQAQQVNAVPYQGGEAIELQQVTPSDVMAASFLDFMQVLPMLMLMFMMMVTMKALQPEVIREVRKGFERVPAAWEGRPLPPERRALPPGE